MFKQRGNTVFAQEASYSLFQVGKPAAGALTAVLEGKDRDLTSWARANDVADACGAGARGRVAGDFRATSAEPALVKQLSYKTSAPEQTLYARMAAASTLGKMRSAQGRTALESLLDESEPLARAEYARALVLIGGRDAIPLHCRSRPGTGRGRHGSTRSAPAGCSATSATSRPWTESPPTSRRPPRPTASATASASCGRGRGEPAEDGQGVPGPPKAAAQCKATMDCWVSKLGDAEGPVRQRAALELVMGKSEAVKPLGEHLADKEPETRAAVLQALMWLVQGDTAAARQLVPTLPRLEQQVSGDRGRQDYAATSEQLRRLITEVRRRAEQAGSRRRPPPLGGERRGTPTSLERAGEDVEGQHLRQRGEEQAARRGPRRWPAPGWPWPGR